MVLVVVECPLRCRCGQSQRVLRRVQSAHLGLRPPVGAPALLARRAAPVRQLLQPVASVLSPLFHPSLYSYWRVIWPVGLELCSVVLGWHCCGTLDASRGEDYGSPVHLRLAGIRHVPSSDV